MRKDLLVIIIATIGLVVILIGLFYFDATIRTNYPSETSSTPNSSVDQTQIKQYESVIDTILTITNISYSEYLPPGNYKILMKTFKPEASATASVSYQEVMKKDKFGNDIYGAFISRLRGCTRDDKTCWIEGGHDYIDLGNVDRFTDLNTTFTVPDNAHNPQISITVTGGSVWVRVFKEKLIG